MSLRNFFFQGSDKLTIWAAADPHVVNEKNNNGYDSLLPVISDIDSESWEFGFILGDYFDPNVIWGNDGEEVVDQFEAGFSLHNISQIYSTQGNHDGVDEDDAQGANWAFQKYIDPIGLQPEFSKIINANRPHAVSGTYEKYSLSVGNILFIMLGDSQEGDPPMGEKGLSGFHPTWRTAGGVQLEAWQWFIDLVIKNPDKIIVVSFHHPLFETTIGSGLTEFTQYGDWDRVDEESDYRGSLSYYGNALKNDEILLFIESNEGSIDFWLSGHIHHRIGSSYLGRSEYINKYGIHHKNVANLTRNLQNVNSDELTVHSFFFDFEGNQVKERAYMHEDKDSEFAQGFLPEFDALYSITKSFSRTYTAPTINTPSTQVTGESISNETSDSLDLSWTNSNTGVVIARLADSEPDFTPVDNTTYYRDQAAVSGAVIFQGTADSFTDFGLTTSTTYHYKIYTYNAGGGVVKYNTTNPVTINGTTQ